MRARVAKKVLRKFPRGGEGAGRRYAEADRVRWRKYMRTFFEFRPLTAGFRWGRWDPKLPMNPKEPPF